VTRLIIIFALAGAVIVLVLFANLLLVATNAGAQTTTFRDRGSTPASSCTRSEMPIFIRASPFAFSCGSYPTLCSKLSFDFCEANASWAPYAVGMNIGGAAEGAAAQLALAVLLWPGKLRCACCNAVTDAPPECECERPLYVRAGPRFFASSGWRARAIERRYET
jgi:hypothetical protein